MSITSVRSSAVYSPPLELPKSQPRIAVQRIAVKEFADSLPGNSNQGSYKPQEITRVAADIERVGQTFNKKLQFVVDQQSQEVIVKVIDKETDKVIKVLPPEELQRLHRKLRETIGFLFNETV